MITSVTTYLEKLQKIQKSIENSKKYSLFYRGVSNTEYAKHENDKPSIYRNTKHIENEHNMYYELISKCADDFKDCDNTFEHLVKMQHYGFPTRLLDITSNALVALYFACSDANTVEQNNLPNGQIIIYKILSTEIRNYESDRVSLLSNLTKAHPYCLYINFILNELTKNLKQLQNSLTEFRQEIANDREIEYVANDYLNEQNISMLTDELKASNSKDIGGVNTLLSDLILFNNNPVNLKLLQQSLRSIKNCQKHLGEYFSRYCYSLKNEKNGFNSDLIIANDLKTVQFVRPKLTNPRIIAQSGFFILFGLNPLVRDKSAPTIDDNFYVDKSHHIIIDANAKINILNELKSLGITNATLFPEISDSAKEIAQKYAGL
ncbi:FRG domain-containing protein [Wohlfahrtiimonas populi]|uniref:FRG domain-containing protein n=1 Tax=Wohlfahrtiimonas populi TaxID=1940240 RepID=UPI00098D2A3F|nr:FRG domain-containing protein [Wohlfahrtiimonas populi]